MFTSVPSCAVSVFDPSEAIWFDWFYNFNHIYHSYSLRESAKTSRESPRTVWDVADWESIPVNYLSLVKAVAGVAEW